jgi:hypothetical protein
MVTILKGLVGSHAYGYATPVNAFCVNFLKDWFEEHE